VVIVSDLDDRIVYQKRLPNELAQIAAALEPFQHELAGVVVEDLQLVLAGGWTDGHRLPGTPGPWEC
jgi:hypothetical protein